MIHSSHDRARATVFSAPAGASEAREHEATDALETSAIVAEVDFRILRPLVLSTVVDSLTSTSRLMVADSWASCRVASSAEILVKGAANA